MNNSKYSIDTSAILDGWKRQYPPDVFPHVWTKLDELIDQGVLIATEEVLYELERKDDDVCQWARQRGMMFMPTNEEIQESMKEIAVDYPSLVEQQRQRSYADPFVIALAMVEGCTVVTGEKPSGSLEKPKIPDVCRALGIPCISILQLFRDRGWAF